MEKNGLRTSEVGKREKEISNGKYGFLLGMGKVILMGLKGFCF
jgi:hypothetical protein